MQINGGGCGLSKEPPFATKAKAYLCNRRIAVVIPWSGGTWWGVVWRAKTTKRRAKSQLLLHHPGWGLNPNWHTTQGAHDNPWINTWVLNTDPGLATPGDAPLCQDVCYPGDFVSFLANTRLSGRNHPIHGPVTGSLLKSLWVVCFERSSQRKRISRKYNEQCCAKG